jgi:predicted Holliday junction resolvase-like endonuclease
MSPLVEITKTGPLEKLVWALIKDPDNEIKTIHNRTEEVTEDRVEHASLVVSGRSTKLGRPRYQRFNYTPLAVVQVAGVWFFFLRLPMVGSFSEKR